MTTSRVVSVVLVILFAAAGYYGWLYGPVYYDDYRIRQNIRDVISSGDRKRPDQVVVGETMRMLEAVDIDTDVVELKAESERGRSRAYTRMAVRYVYTPTLVPPFGEEVELRFEGEVVKEYDLNW